MSAWKQVEGLTNVKLSFGGFYLPHICIATCQNAIWVIIWEWMNAQLFITQVSQNRAAPQVNYKFHNLAVKCMASWKPGWALLWRKKVGSYFSTFWCALASFIQNNCKSSHCIKKKLVYSPISFSQQTLWHVFSKKATCVINSIYQ